MTATKDEGSSDAAAPTPSLTQAAPPPSSSESPSPFAPTPPRHPTERASSPSQRRPQATTAHIDALLAKWRAAVAARFTPRPREPEIDPLPLDKGAVLSVWKSVFPELREGDLRMEAAEERRKDGVTTLDHKDPMSHEEFAALVKQVRLAIDAGVHPRLNSKGSSGSYFARNVTGRTLGIFKPADEEPYGTLNPKFVKWVHREFLSRVIPFGRACLIPGQSYLSEAAASIVDAALGTHIVPRTEVVALSSEAFFYDWVDRERASRKGAQLRPKEGSFQVFLEGFVDASAFLARHPFPGRPVAPTSKQQNRDSQPRRRGHRRGCCTAALLCLCGRTGAERDEPEHGSGVGDGGGAGGAAEEQPPRAQTMSVDGGSRQPGAFAWTAGMVDSFREELEKLVVLDVLIRNTDRGLDNFMLKPCTATCSPSSPSHPHLHLAAIDNSLAFPHQHPSGWRTYTYGWLYLPLSLIGQPWSAKARAHFLPLLADPAWWSALKVQLRSEFSRDRAFSEGMWEKQWSVVKGQGYLLVESLRSPDEGPVELCRRPKKLVIDEYRLVPSSATADAPPAPSPHLRRLGSEPGLPIDGQTRGGPLDAQRSAAERPPLPERRSAPAEALPHVVIDSINTPAAPTVPASPSKPLVVRHAQHRRSRSDLVGGATSASSAPARDLSASFDGTASARYLRAPLDSLAAAPTRSDAAESDGDGDSDGEETGVALLSRLDRVEATEARRLKRVRRDRAARAALDEAAGAASDGEGAVGRGARRGVSALLGGRRGSRGARHRAREGVREVDERTALLDGRIDEGEEDEDEGENETVDGEADGRMVMSWYGGQGRVVSGRDEEARTDDAVLAKRTAQWVVFERLEDVKESARSRLWRW